MVKGFKNQLLYISDLSLIGDSMVGRDWFIILSYSILEFNESIKLLKGMGYGLNNINNGDLRASVNKDVKYFLIINKSTGIADGYWGDTGSFRDWLDSYSSFNNSIVLVTIDLFRNYMGRLQDS